MFGNLMGWVISAFIATVAVILGYQLLQLAQPTGTTGWVKQAVLPLQMAESAKTILLPMDDLKDDAGALYRQAIADYEAHKSQYQDLQKSQDYNESAVNELEGLDDLVKAAGCPSMDLFKSKPDDLVGFTSPIPELDDLDDIARTVESVIASSKFEKHFDVATKYANALAAMGYHLYKERVAYAELSAGENYLGSGCAALVEIAQAQNQDDKVTADQQFDAARKQEHADRIDPVIKVITGQSQQDIGDHAGDMYQLAADQSADRMWRVEAIRKIGRLRFNAERSADQLKSPKFLASLSSDPDPVIRAAAAKAHDMTESDNQAQR